MDSSDIEEQSLENASSMNWLTDIFPNSIRRYLRFFPSRGDNAPPTELLPPSPTVSWSDFFVSHGRDVQMTPDVFSGISGGNIECLNNATSMACLKSSSGDSVLHLAVTGGHVELAKEIFRQCPSLLLQPNSVGQTPLHVAAYGGHDDIVKDFITLVTRASAERNNEESEELNPYVLKDKDGNTALHLAIKGSYMEMATSLVEANQNASFLENEKGISSLYLAVKSGDVHLVNLILGTIGDEDTDLRMTNLCSKLQGRKYLAHVALKAKTKGVFDVILEKYPSLVNERNKMGRTCLSYAIFIEHYEGVFTLLERDTRLLEQDKKSVYVCNEDGSFPIHTASEKGDSLIVRHILDGFSDSKYLRNEHGQNILHIATKNGMSRLLRDLMTYEEDMERLGVMQDKDGNTPLHLAVLNWHSKCITLVANSSKILKIRNKEAYKARDIAESKLQPNYIFKERFTLALILYAMHSRNVKHVHSLTRESKPTDPKDNRDYVNTLLLVATLVATVTFAAGFTMPGGFNSSGADLGRATLANDPTLYIFMILDILAMQSAVAAICTLIWAQLGDPALIRSSLNVALPLLLFALLCMPLVFLFGVITAVGHVKWLLIVKCIISSIFVCWAIFVLGPHVMLQGSYVPPKYAGDFLVTFMQYKGRFESFVFWIKVIVYKLVLRDRSVKWNSYDCKRSMCLLFGKKRYMYLTSWDG